MLPFVLDDDPQGKLGKSYKLWVNWLVCSYFAVANLITVCYPRLRSAQQQRLLHLAFHFLPLPFPCIDSRTSKHHRRAQQNSRRQLVPKQPNTDQQACQLPHIEHYGHAQRGRARAQEVDAADTEVLRQGVEGQVENIFRNGEDGERCKNGV